MPYLIPMHVLDIFKFVKEERNEKDFLILLNYVQFEYIKLYRKIFPEVEMVEDYKRFLKTTVPVSSVPSSSSSRGGPPSKNFSFDIQDDNVYAKEICEMMQKYKFIPKDFKMHSSICVDYLLQINNPELFSKPMGEKRTLSESESDFDCYELEDEKNVNFGESISQQLGENSFLRKDIFPRNPIPLTSDKKLDLKLINKLCTFFQGYPEPVYVKSLLYRVNYKYGSVYSMDYNCILIIALLCKKEDMLDKDVLVLKEEEFPDKKMFNYVDYLFSSVISVADDLKEKEDVEYFETWVRTGGQWPDNIDVFLENAKNRKLKDPRIIRKLPFREEDEIVEIED